MNRTAYCPFKRFGARFVDVARGLPPRWSGRLKDKVPSSDIGVRAARLNR
jgi:hypothetical protein